LHVALGRIGGRFAGGRQSVWSGLAPRREPFSAAIGAGGRRLAFVAITRCPRAELRRRHRTGPDPGGLLPVPILAGRLQKAKVWAKRRCGIAERCGRSL